jgi:hypothetical protein
VTPATARVRRVRLSGAAANPSSVGGLRGDYWNGGERQSCDGGAMGDGRARAVEKSHSSRGRRAREG